MYSRITILIVVIVNKVATATANKRPLLAVDECVIIDMIATHLYALVAQERWGPQQ